MFRKTLFWLHLVAGLISGLSIGIMCFTGVVLAFEKQLVAWSERDARLVPAESVTAQRLTIDEMTERVREARPDAKPMSITEFSDPRKATMIGLGRDDAVFVNPYTGEVRTPASTTLHDFMHVMVDWHRFLALSGDNRPTGKLINGICNIAFCVLAVTGLYLWMPRHWSWRSVRAVSVFNWRLTGKARDFNWHNAIGLWSAPILIVLTLTAIPISFRWGNALVYRLVGEEPPAQAGPGAAPQPTLQIPPVPERAKPVSREQQFAAVRTALPTWEQISLRLGGGPGRGGNAGRGEARPASAGPQPLTFTVKTPDAWPRTATTSVIVDPFTAEIVRRDAFSDLSAGRQLRSWTRFLHTGEALGWGGQLTAGLATLGGCFLVYTGFALSWRRFFGKKS